MARRRTPLCIEAMSSEADKRELEEADEPPSKRTRAEEPDEGEIAEEPTPAAAEAAVEAASAVTAAVPATVDGMDRQNAATDQLPLLRGVLVISPGHRVAAASRCVNPPRSVAGRVDAASLST